MKRPIIPINIPLSNRLVTTPEDIKELYRDDIETFSILFHNGDISRICHAFSMMDIFDLDKIIKIKKLGYIEQSDDAFVQDDKHRLLAKKYTTSTQSIDSSLAASGYHKHRTLVDCGNNTIYVNENFSISDLLLRNVTLVIKENVLISLNSLMLDNVKIVLDNKSIISVDDVEFSNSDDYCISLKKMSEVTSFKNVRFFDVKKRFFMEHANSKMHSALLDFHNTDDIIDFLSFSRIVKIELIDDFVATMPNLHFNQNIEFINSAERVLLFNAPAISLSNDFVLSGAFINSANYTIIEMDLLKISLSNFSGKLTVMDADDITLFNTLFKDISSKTVEFIKSNINILNTTIDNCTEPIGIYNSSIKIESVTIQNTASCFGTIMYKQDEDETLYDAEMSGNEVQIKGSKIISSTLLGNLLIEKIVLARVKLYNISTLINAENTILNIFRVESENVDTIAFLRNSELRVSDSDFVGGDKAFNISDSLAHINNTNISKYNRGLKQKDGVVQLYSVDFDDCNICAELYGDHSVLKHHSLTFNNIHERKLLHAAGSIVINMEEEEEAIGELCQIN